MAFPVLPAALPGTVQMAAVVATLESLLGLGETRRAGLAFGVATLEEHVQRLIY